MPASQTSDSPDRAASPDKEAWRILAAAPKDTGDAHRVARAGFLLGVFATVIPLGAVDVAPFAIALAVNSAVLAYTCFVQWRNRDVMRLYATAAGLLSVLGAWVVAQAVTLSDHPWAHPVWNELSRKLGETSGAISVDPSATLAAFPTLAMPFFIFMSALALHQSDAAALRLYRALTLFGLALAVYGIVQHEILSTHLILGTRVDRTKSLTAVFVNRNSAGACLGLSLLLALGLCARNARHLALVKVARRLLAPRLEWDRPARLLLGLCACGVIVLALLLTQSRGTIVAAICAAGLAVLLFLGDPARQRVRRSPWRAALAAAVWVATSGLVLFLFASRTLVRVEAQGLEDGRWCTFRSTIRAIGDHPLLGTGFGTFSQVFPAYRIAACGTDGVWERAHNSFLEAILGLGLIVIVPLGFGLMKLVKTYRIGLVQRRRQRFAPAVGLAALLFITIASLVDFPTQVPGVAAYFAAILGVTCAISLGRGTPAEDSKIK
jgi:O-antigen ligase